MPEDAIRMHPNCPVRRGHAHGLRGPVLSVGLQWPTAGRWDTELLASWLHQAGGLKHEVIAERLRDGLGLDAFLSLVLALEQAAHAPVTQCGVRTGEHFGGMEHALAFPSSVPGFTLALVHVEGEDVRITVESGHVVKAIARAHLSIGGTSRDVLAVMHPDSARLAVRAARALRLDIAGIDLP